MFAAVEKRYQAIEDLIREVETKAADEPDTLALVIVLIKFAVLRDRPLSAQRHADRRYCQHHRNKRIPRRLKAAGSC